MILKTKKKIKKLIIYLLKNKKKEIKNGFINKRKQRA